jgi:HlyD family secretion protein
MKRGYGHLILLLLIVGAGGVLVWYYTRPEPIEIRVRPVERGLVERTVVNTRAGTVEACRRAKLSPSIGGQISKLPVREGDRVKAESLLLELWNKDLAAEVRLAESETRAARARAEAACLKAQEAQREADRLVRLRKIGAASEERTDKAVTGARALKADCEAARTSVLTSQARVGVTRARLERTRLIAPFDGVIAEINGELNEYLTPSPPGIPTPPAVDLIDNSCFYVTAPIDEVDAPEIAPGMTARITMDAFGDRHFQGRVRRIAPYVLDREKQARTVDVEVVFTNPEDIRRLLAGYSADVEIILDVKKDTLRLPTEAVLDGKRVFVFLREEGVIRARALRRGLSNWNYTEVLSGLKEGEQVVVNVDQAGLEDGAHAVVAEGEP